MKNKRNLAYINELKLLSLPTCLGISYIRLQSILISSPVSPPQKNKGGALYCLAEGAMGNEGVLIQLAQCWFPGLAIFNAKI